MTLYESGAYYARNPGMHLEDSAWKARQIVAMLETHGIKPAAIGDVGCGAGEILNLLSARFPQARLWGYDIAADAVAEARRRANDRFTVHLGEVPADAAFDLLLCSDVFEHVEDHFGFLRRIRDRATWKLFQIPLDLSVLSLLTPYLMANRRGVGHLHYFTRETALATLEECGYAIVDSRYIRWYENVPQTTFRARLARLCRRTLDAVSPDLLAKLMPGLSLMVLAR